MLDVAIRGGEVIDGTGAPRRRADVGIRDGRVVEIGESGEPARRTIDADGRVVAPGFVDVHTHYDAQAFWDPTLSPSPLHGVTTVVGGNCGFSIAPIDDRAADYVMRMLARVEGMPLASLEQGVPWSWRTMGEYLDRLDGTLALNAGFLAGHSAIRRLVMGEASTERSATDDELAAMIGALRDALADGALGFSTSWGFAHRDAAGVPVPSRHAPADELVALAAVCREFDGTSLEFAPPSVSLPFDHDVVDVMVRMSVTSGRQLNWNVLFPTMATADDVDAKLAIGSESRARGGNVVALTIPMELGVRFNFLGGFVLDGLPDWAPMIALPPAEKLRVLRDPAERRRLGELALRPGPARDFAEWADFLVFETFTPATKRYAGRRVGDIAAEEGKEPFDALLDIVCADDLRTCFGRLPRRATREEWELRLRVWRDDRAVIGAGDAGAHLDMLAGFYYTTQLLEVAVREEQLLGLEEAVRLLTDVPARLYGLRGRGRLTEGACADVVVLDPTTIAADPLEMRFDLPGGAGRLYAGATGVDHVLVNGEEVVASGVITDARRGTLLRAGRDTTQGG